MPRRFNPPPNWPTPPAAWQPPVGWQADPTWGPVPDGWQLWIAEPANRHPWRRAFICAAILGLVYFGLTIKGFGRVDPEGIAFAVVTPTLAALITGLIARRAAHPWGWVRYALVTTAFTMVASIIGGIARLP